jgi:hypothetical protein
MPEIRSLTAPLIEFLNVEVETLDTLQGIDASSIPEGFAEQAATFRLATSISADPPPINLLPAGVTSAPGRHTGGWLVAGGAAAAIALAFIYSDSESSSSRMRTPVESAAVERADPFERVPVQSEPLELPATPTPAPQASPSAAPLRPQQQEPQPVPRRSAAVVPSPMAPPQPDPVVRSILVSGNRRVALIDGRIVSAGDSVGNAVVTSIEPDAVVLATADGQSRRIALVRPTPPAAR